MLKEKAEANKDCEIILCNTMNNEVTFENIKLLQHENIVKANCDQLKAFILARKKDVCKSHLPNKGKVANETLGGKNLISLAFDCREMPNLLMEDIEKAKEKVEEVNQITEVAAQNDFVRHDIILSESNNNNINASTILSNNEWIESAKQIFDPLSLTTSNPIDATLIDKADVLQKKLVERLTHHIRRRVNPKKQNHWCLSWASSNFAQMAALMILSNHIKDEIDCLDSNTTLLKRGEYFFITAENEEAKKQGVYLHYDTNDGKWIRSGKVTGRGFDARNKEHRKYAAAKHATSRFYRRYPTKSSV